MPKLYIIRDNIIERDIHIYRDDAEFVVKSSIHYGDREYLPKDISKKKEIIGIKIVPIERNDKEIYRYRWNIFDTIFLYRGYRLFALASMRYFNGRYLLKIEEIYSE